MNHDNIILIIKIFSSIRLHYDYFYKFIIYINNISTNATKFQWKMKKKSKKHRIYTFIDKFYLRNYIFEMLTEHLNIF